MTNRRFGFLAIGALVASMGSLTCSAQTSRTMAIRTSNGHYLTAVNGGGLGGPDSGPGTVALHTDATSAGPWEHFTIVRLDPDHFALRTSRGNYVTAVNGGGIGGPNDSSAPIHTDAVRIGPWEKMRINFLPGNQVTINVLDGRFLTAVDGGGVGGPNTTPVHTNAVRQGPWEVFTLVPVP